jgi:hypothetical protein
MPYEATDAEFIEVFSVGEGQVAQSKSHEGQQALEFVDEPDASAAD